ncbi:LysR family transcriptional regulator [Massilia agilis]
MTQMDRFHEMQIFVRIVARRSFTQAAEELMIPRATATNAIKRLESRLGTRLLDRTTRAVAPTQDGAAYYERCVRLLADLDEAEGAFRGTEPAGLLRVNLQPTLARHFVFPALPAFLARYPRLQLHVGEDDRLVDLVREGVDCVLRVGQLQDSSMVARRAAKLEQLTVASGAYLDRHGTPTTLADLARHRAVHYVSTATGRPYPLEFVTGSGIELATPPGVVSVTGTEAYTAAAIAGLGLVQVPRYRIADQLATGLLRPVLADMPPPPIPVSVLYPRQRQLSARVRVFADWLVQLFRDS